jgi:hypothetical protein
VSANTADTTMNTCSKSGWEARALGPTS